MLFYNAGGMQVTDDIAYHDNDINTIVIQKLCFCFILRFFFKGRGIAVNVNAFFLTLLDDIHVLLVFYWNMFHTYRSQSWAYFKLYIVLETRMAIFICSRYVKYYGNAVCKFLKYHCQ